MTTYGFLNRSLKHSNGDECEVLGCHAENEFLVWIKAKETNEHFCYHTCPAHLNDLNALVIAHESHRASNDAFLRLRRLI